MILTNSFIVHDSDLSQFAWNNLRRFHNSDFVEGQLLRHHRLGKDQRQNAKKQASQIRHCLVQAREYFEAAERVSLATKPTLAYYGIMSLALAELLFKQSGNSSLDRAREVHKHHGLVLRIDSLPTPQMALPDATSRLAAVPLIKRNINQDGSTKEIRTGTFELWHRSAREMPIVAQCVRHAANEQGSTTSYDVVATSKDVSMPVLPSRGLTLFECLRKLPCMGSHLNISGLHADIVRSKATAVFRPAQITMNFLLHPAEKSAFDEFCNNFKFAAGEVDRINFRPGTNAGEVQWTYDDPRDPVQFSLPSCSMWKRDELHFWLREEPLNEFGFFYFCLYILGNYARYYPDRWMLDVDRGSALALATEELLRAGAVRIPMLALSELSRTYYIPAN